MHIEAAVTFWVSVPLKLPYFPADEKSVEKRSNIHKGCFTPRISSHFIPYALLAFQFFQVSEKTEVSKRNIFLLFPIATANVDVESGD